jgi:hypothetical protein
MPWVPVDSRRVVCVLLLFGGIVNAGCATCVANVLLTPGKRELNALKNRTQLPDTTDFDPRVSLATMLGAGNDRTRWNQLRAGVIEGVVVRVHDAGVESANCFSPTRLDAHVEVAQHADAPPRERVIVEVTPPMRAWAARQGRDWSTPALQRQLTGRRVRFEGWLLFDSEHVDEAENTRPGHEDNWRATAWEIHPVTAIEVVSTPAREF